MIASVFDLIEGEVYLVDWCNDIRYLFEYSNKHKHSSIEILIGRFNLRSGDFTGSKFWNRIEVADEKSKFWLKSCIEAEHFIPFSEINFKKNKVNYKYLIKILKRYNIK